MGVLAKKHVKVQIDETLFSRIRQGDERAFEELYYITYKPLYAFILSMTLNREDSEDILQETYIKIRGACHLYQSQGNPMAWIMKIAKNEYLMKLRKEKKYEMIDIQDCNNLLFLNQIPEMENQLFLEQLFQSVSPEDRDIIIMHVNMGMKHREIAEIKGLPVGTVLSRYHRAMKLLKSQAEVPTKEGV